MTSNEPDHGALDPAAGNGASDEPLLAASREGSVAAFGILYARYRPHAVSVARRTLGRDGSSLVDDVVEAAFIEVLKALQNGAGPTDTLRHYLTTAVRRQAWRAQRRQRRQGDIADRWVAAGGSTEVAPAGAVQVDETAGLGSHGLLTDAFRELPERWRYVLWATEVEGRKPSEVATLLGISARSASALAYRARRGLTAAYLAAYAATRSDPECRAVAPELASYLAATAGDVGVKVRRHLERCAACRDASRGVDVPATALRSMAPFGVLTTGWWAKAIGAGAGAKAALVGSAAATTGAAMAVHAGAGASGGSGVAAAGAATGGATSGGFVAAVAVVVTAVLGVAAAVGIAAGGGGDGHGAGQVA
ncbi:MAG: sigma-70 family RNA polymerase sigma factor, partial [Acidimicrobiales bacterium]|nr:sigma-70 family RNA polymerase sigma factor [Acidimicrobiales bacterium]